MNQNDIHVMKRKCEYIVFHPESLSMFLVPKDLGEILDIYENVSNSKMAANEINANRKHNNNILNNFFERFGANLSKDPIWTNGVPRSLCLFISHNCNLKCGYCFADYREYKKDKKLMKLDTAKKCIDKFFAHDHKNFIVYYGGEPLINFPLMKDIENYRNEVGLEINYTGITNGTIVCDKIKQFMDEHFMSLCISLDGYKEINDLQRFGKKDSVHDIVIKTIDMMKSRRYPLGIKSIITKKNFDKLPEIVEYIRSLNVDSMSFAFVSMIPQESDLYLSDDEYGACVNDLTQILKKEIYKLAKGEKIVLKQYIFGILRQILTRTRKLRYCSAGKEYLAITAEGDVYPCHGFVDMAEFYMGNVHDENFPGEKYYVIVNMFNNIDVRASTECKYCWARYLCGGDCICHSYIYNKDLLRPTKRRCLLIKSILEALLPELAVIFQDDIKTQNIINLFNTLKHKQGYYNTVIE